MNSNRQGKLVHYAKGSTFFVNYPITKISHEEVTAAQIDYILDQRINHTRKSGQSGFKRNTDGTMWLKDKNSLQRIQCEEVGSKECVINGETKNVPVFEPCRITYK